SRDFDQIASQSLAVLLHDEHPAFMQGEYGHRAGMFDHLPTGRVPVGQRHIFKLQRNDVAVKHRLDARRDFLERIAFLLIRVHGSPRSREPVMDAASRVMAMTARATFAISANRIRSSVVWIRS